MNLSELEDMWDEEYQFKVESSLLELNRYQKMHSKYYRLLNAEKKVRNVLQANLSVLHKELWLTLQEKVPEKKLTYREQQELAKLPKVLKSDIPMLIEANSEYLELKRQISDCDIKIKFIESILSQLDKPSYLLSAVNGALNRFDSKVY
jgi:hydrogenase maturation factor HypF (carbamoyltransferase family)